MNLFCKKHILFLSVFLLLFFDIYPQIRNDRNSFIQQNFIISIGSGVTYGLTDYQNSKLGPLIYGSFEYYPITMSNARIGFKLFGGGLRINQSDNRGLIATDDIPNPRQVPTEIYTDMIQIGGSVDFGYAVSKSLIPYISVGLTHLSFSPKSSDGHILEFNSLGKYDKKIFSFIVEGGVKYQIGDRFSLNAAVNYYPTSTDYLDDISAPNNKDAFLSALVGVSFALSGNRDSDGDGVDDQDDLCPDTPPGVKVDEYGCPIDSDKDGVPDYLDKCPNTPIGVIVDEFGCPIDSDKDGVPDYLDKCPNTPLGLPVNADGCPPDEDNDGVPDYLDKCPHTPLGVKVDSVGCPIDSDKDGVPDYLDKCPDTPPNTKVDSTGCPKEGSQEESFYQFILRGDDTFETNTANIKNGAKLLLNEIAFYIQNQPGTKWRIEGHMDSQGSITFIKKLSYDRAKAVLDYLVSQGLSPDQFTLYGLGDSFPIANSNSEEGRSTNRRIMIIKED
jgi:OOP family OmpA-OmpF porin